MAAMRESSLYNQGRCFATCSVFFLLNLRAATVVGLFSYELLSGTRLILVCGVFFFFVVFFSFFFFYRILTVKRISWLLMLFCSSGSSEAEAT